MKRTSLFTWLAAFLGLATWAFLSHAAAGLPVPEWIWAGSSSTADQTAYFRKHVIVKPGVLKSILLGACAGRMTVYVNGRRAGEISGRERANGLDVTDLVHAGENVLALEVTPGKGSPGTGILLEVAYRGGSQEWFVTDASWKVASAPEMSWTLPEFNDSRWRNVFSFGKTDSRPKENPFDPQKAFDAYNSWKLALGSNLATPAESLTVLPGFKVELLRSAQPEEDSWIAMAFDPQGRLTVAREKRGLIRFTLGDKNVKQVEVINDTLLECRGLLYAFDSLYVSANNSKGFYRLRATSGNGQFNEIKELLHTEGGVGHGRNHVKLGPDNKIYLAHGNDVRLTALAQSDSPHRNFKEDQLIPCPWDDTWFNGDVLAPGGHILRTDADGKNWEMVAGGFRNELDVAFNSDGELFTYDADMERDIGTPWYRPTRINHVVSGGEYGWRRGTGKWPAYSPDSLPSTLDIGVGSPTGIEFGYKSHFPEKYRQALFICDWAYGRVLAVHLKPQGASYSAASENFLTGRPLNVTDLAFGPDGAMYVITGGRRTQSGLYRVSYAGPKIEEERKSPGVLASGESAAQARATRHWLESFHGSSGTMTGQPAVDAIWPHLGNQDFWIRYAARIALENQAVRLWQERALSEKNTDASLTALMALARLGDKELKPAILERLRQLPLEQFSEAQQLNALRDLELVFCRMGSADAATAEAFRQKLAPLYPSRHRWVNHQLCELLVYLRSPEVVPNILQLVKQADNSQDLLQYLFFLNYVPQGWSVSQRQTYFEGLERADKFHGDRYYVLSLEQLRTEMTAILSPAERAALKPLLEKKGSPASLPAVPLQFVKDWRMEDLAPILGKVSRGRSYSEGRSVFVAAQCVLCHRIGSDPGLIGGVVGPDLTAVASRFSARDILDSILQPSKVIDEKYRNAAFKLADGNVIYGIVAREDASAVYVRTNPLSEETTAVPIKDIRSRGWSEISPMPEGLLNVLQRDQILDLLAFLESGGNPEHPTFKK